jgi:hypothetical protein
MTVRAFLDDERGIVASFLIKVVLGLAVAGTLLIEGGSILFTKLRVQDVAESAATAGVGQLNTLRNCNAAGDAAVFAVQDKDPRATLKSYECHPDGRFTVVVTKQADTLYVHRIGFLKDYVTATSRVTAQPAAPNF